MVILLERIPNAVLEEETDVMVCLLYSDIAGFKFWIPVSIVNFGYSPLSSAFTFNSKLRIFNISLNCVFSF
jgi:hypothetical protein